jgi:hypothetical protein
MTMGRHHRGLLHRIAKLAIVLTLTLSLGAHWLFLQSVAWFGMVVTYSQSAPLDRAFEMTFDGQHPCKLCKLVKAGQAAEKKPDSKKPVTKLDFALVLERAAFIVPQPHQPASVSVAFLLVRTESPPTPPPRPA